MKVQQTFSIAQPRERVWAFFLNIPDVARCVPGVEDVQLMDDDNARVRLTQSVGPMSATFDLKMRITERVELERMQFTAAGKAVKGAAGSVRSVSTVSLAPDGEGTRVDLDSDMAMGGVLGSIGQKVIAKQAKGVTADFAAALERSLNGEPPVLAGGAPARNGAKAGSAAVTSNGGGTRRSTAAQAAGFSPASAGPVSWYEDPRVTGLAGLSIGLAIALGVALVRH